MRNKELQEDDAITINFYHTGVEYQSAASVLHDKPLVASMLLAFSCECFLKAIIFLDKPDAFKVTGHNLEILFGKLKAERQADLKELKKTLVDHKNLFMDSRYFVVDRYIYEKDENKMKEKKSLIISYQQLAEVSEYLKKYIGTISKNRKSTEGA